MSRNDKARRARSDSPEHDEDSDYQIALRLSEELNGGQLPLAGASKPTLNPIYDADADFAYALEVQFGDSNESYERSEVASAPRFGSTERGKSAQSEVPPWAHEEDKKKVANYHKETPGCKNFTTIANFMQHVQSAQCSNCGNPFFQSDLDIGMMLQRWRSGNTTLTCSLKCSGCSTTSCIACKPLPFSEQSTVSVRGRRVTWCCGGGRLFLLWLLLCDLDEKFAVLKAKETKASQLRQQPQGKPGKTKKSSKRARGGGIGFGGPLCAMGAMPSGLGFASDGMIDFDDEDSYLAGPGQTFGGHKSNPNAGSTGAKAKALTAQTVEDQSNTLHFELIESLLPSLERESGFDFDPPDAVADMLLQGKVLHYCTQLLRNDSLEDATKRMGIYQALINLLRTLGGHYKTASRTIFDERPSIQDKVNLLELCWRQRFNVSQEKTSSLYHCLNNLSTQSDLVLVGAKKNEAEFQSHDGQNLLLLCRCISDLSAYLSANAGIVGGSKPKEAEISALEDRQDDVILASHKFAPSANALTSAPAGRFKRLLTEITTLKTGLPAGIFVRYAESRPDVQKVLIIGPAGTPYENGLFEFDVFCNASFPNAPPQVDFKTTGGGRVSFNPNLYADGKVCLSLLGTWQGEPWVPNESTLLQIFISIQAMILCDEPWYNEPGREMTYNRDSSSGTGVSASYNQAIRQHTVRTAILDWLEKTPMLWKDVIDQHFKTNANEILKSAVEWAQNDDSACLRVGKTAEQFSEGFIPDLPGSYRAPHQTDIKSMLPQLQKALEKYGVDKVVSEKLEPVFQTPESPRFSKYKSPYFQPPPYLPPPVVQQTPKQPKGFSIPSSSFSDPGTIRGDALTEASDAASHGRGTGRYETRSSTRGYGGPSAHIPLMPPGSSSGFGRGGVGVNRGGSTAPAIPPVQAYPGVPNLWPFDQVDRGGYGGGRGGRGGGRGNPPGDLGRGGREGRGGRGGPGSFIL